MNNLRKSEIKARLSEGDTRYKLVTPSKLKSLVWHNFNLIEFNGKLEEFACCKKCKDVLAYSTKTGTGSLIRHNCDQQNGRRRTTKAPKNGKFQNVSKTADPLEYSPKNVDHKKTEKNETVIRKKNCVDTYDDNTQFHTESVIKPEIDIADEVYGEDIDMEYLTNTDPAEEHLDSSNPDYIDNVFELLMQNHDGQNALRYYDLHNRLDLRHRKNVLNILTDNMHMTEYNKYNDILKKIANQLMQVFPHERYTSVDVHKSFTRNVYDDSTKREDFQLYNLLSSWNLPHLYDTFKDENITIDILKFLEPKYIERLFRSLTVGDEVRFCYQLKTWLDAGSPLELNEPLTEINPVNLTLATILRTSGNGDKIRKFYEQHGQLNEQHRVMLINMISRYIELNGLNLSVSKHSQLEQEITKMFPTEKLEYYSNSKRAISSKTNNSKCFLKHLNVLSGN